MLTIGFEVTATTPPAPTPGTVAWERRLDPDGAAGVLEPWSILPSQVVDGNRAELSGERRLLAAVLADAIRLYLKHARSRTASGQILFRETESWVESRDRRSLVAFESVCDVLHVDADRLRRALRFHAFCGLHPTIPVDAGRVRVARGRKIRV
jgi:hypothetical protein